MIYLFDHRVVFYHVPKTAGGSITHWLQQPSNGATALIEPLHMMPWRFEKYPVGVNWSFCVVRNPWDRWVSWWWFWKYLAKRIDYSFEEYTKKFFGGEFVGRENEGGQYGTCAPQSYYFKHVTEILRHETLDEDFKKVQVKLNNFSSLRKISNISRNKQHYRTYYTKPELVDIVSEYYKEDAIKLGYSYE